MAAKQLFDDWPDRYDHWFETPVGRAVLRFESELVLFLLRPAPGELILDAGSGTGLFTEEFLKRGAKVAGIDISFAMLRRAKERAASCHCLWGLWAAADMVHLPFADGTFDKTVSVAALEFIADARRAVAELFRVTRPGGVVVAATLNSLSPWADRRLADARRDPASIFRRVVFRSPAQLMEAAPVAGVVRTAIHFGKDDNPGEFDRIERAGRGRETGAFVAARWEKRKK